MRSGTESSQHYLASFVPILKDWLAVSKFPHLQEATIQPLERLLQGIPNRRMLEEALDLQVAYEQLEQLKRALTDIVGLSMFYGEVLDAAGMQAILSSTDFPEIAEIFLFRRQDISVLEKRLEGIKVKLDSVHYVLRALVENQEAVVEVLTRIRTHHLSPMKVILERMESRSFFEKSLRLDVLFRDLIGMERFMMRLWDALDEEDVSLREQDVVDSGGKGAHANPLLRYLVCSQGASQLTLLDQMGQLEEHADETHKKLNAIVFVLTFVDKLAIKVRGQLEEILDMQHSVIEIDHRNRAMVLGGAAAVERRFLEFMENNRLFFLSLPGRVGTLFEKVDSLLQDPGVAEAHNVELFRGVESRTFKLHQFMKHSLEFFDGRRDRLELPPSFAFSGTVEGDVSGNRVLEGTSLGADSDSPEVIGQTVKRIRTCLREISLAEWDLLKLPIPPQSVMEIFEANRNSIERSWVETERIQSALERGSTEGEPVHFALLGEDARALLNTLDSIQKQVVVLPIVDRRLSSAHAVDPTTGRRLVDKVDDFCKTQVSSRRSMERVVAHHPVELRFPGVGTFKGVIHDVSKTGVCVETDQPPSNGLKQEMDGSIRLISDKQGNKINCRVKRLTGHMLGLAIDEASQAGFSQVVRREITGGKANVG
ncbi:MAG TPA: PilZ domain-containing protein, partial [Magnetococcales bacterium]|nr:PilZ domain-containing protein [Magnetococcales bacterium]